MGKGLLTKLFHNIPNAKVARFLGFIQGFHGQTVDANTVSWMFFDVEGFLTGAVDKQHATLRSRD